MDLNIREQVLEKEAWRLFLRQPIPTYIVNLKPVLKGVRALNFVSLLGLDEYLIKHTDIAKGLLRKMQVLAANPAAQELVEVADEKEFIDYFPEFFIDESIRALRSSLLQLAEGEDEFEDNIPIISRSGRKLVIQFFMRPLYEGDLSQVICNFTEITHWKRAEEALGREQETLKGSPVFSFRWRNAPGWPVESVSPNIVQLGYMPEELLSGRVPFASMVHPDDLQRITDEVAQYSATGQTGFEQDYRIFTASGELRWTYDYTSIVRDPDGEITHYDGFLLDITSRKLAEQKLAESELELNFILDNAPIGIWLQDCMGKLRYANWPRRSCVTPVIWPSRRTA